MNLLSLKALGVVPVVGLVAAAPCFAEGRHHIGAQDFLLYSAPTPVDAPRIWVKLLNDVSVQALADDLNLDPATLAELNELPKTSSFKKGQWVALPQSSQRLFALSSYVDASRIRNSAPLETPPSPADVVEIISGDRIASIASRHGLSLAELRRLNPGVNLARLVVGSQLRVAKAAPGALLAIRPTMSGGASWPAFPSKGSPGVGPSTPEKERIRAQIERNKAAKRLAAIRAEEARRQRYKQFGDCTYDWGSWFKSPQTGVRGTTAVCGSSRYKVAVDCKKLQISRLELLYKSLGWSQWKNPDGTDEDMVVELCGNLPQG